MNRKLATATLVAALLAGSGAATAQDFVFGWNPRSGDVWVDQTLGDVNDYGYRYRESFIDELVRYYGAPRDYVGSLLLSDRWAPGDVYYACAIGQVTGRSCRYVAEQWEQHHGEGWGAMAQRMGIKPGSEEFHRLKRGFVPTYDHWARPLRLDDGLRRAFPDRGRATTEAVIREHRLEVRGNGNARPKFDNGNRGRGNAGDAKGNAGKVRGNEGQGKAKGNNGKAKGNNGKGNNGKGNGKG